jgi:hypothetical protein
METHSCSHHAHPHAHARWLPRLDAFGSAAAFVCALHCAFLPIAAVAMPLAAVELLANHVYELVFVMFALAFGAAVLSTGMSRSRRGTILSLYFASVALLLAGVANHEQVILHAVLMVLGGLSLGSAHALNRHFVRTHDDAQTLWRRGNAVIPGHSAGADH